MKLGVVLPVGGSLSGLEKAGQLGRFINYYLAAYLKEFNQVVVFSYKKELGFGLPNKCLLIDNRWGLHRYLYAILFPVLHYKKFQSLSVVRATQFSSIIPALVAKALFLKKIVVTYGYNYQKFALAEKNYLVWLYYLILDLFLARFADKLIFTNKSLYEEKRKKFTNCVWLPNGVDIAVFKPKRNMLAGSFRILTIGRLEPQKRFALLVEAIASLPERKSIELTLIANGQLLLKTELEKLAKHRKVKLAIIDRVPHNQLPEIYNSCDLFVLPSLVEGSSKVLLEAASCGCALVVRDLPENGDVVINEKTGLTFHQDEQLGGKLQGMIKNPQLRKELGDAARKRVEEYFDLRKVLRKEAALLTKL